MAKRWWMVFPLPLKQGGYSKPQARSNCHVTSFQSNQISQNFIVGTDGLTDRRTDGPTDRRTDEPMDRRTDGPTDRRTDGLTDGPPTKSLIEALLRA
jgi:hypothetical protein